MINGDGGAELERSGPEQHESFTIAGIKAIDLGDTPQRDSTIARLRREYDKSFTATGERDYFGDPRLPDLELGLDTDVRVPIQTFLLNETLVRAMEEGSRSGGLSETELLRLALATTEGAVQPNFSADAMNAINASYYASEIAFGPEAGLATMYAENRPLNAALGNLLAASVAKDTVKVKELCSGTRPEHWGVIADAFKNGQLQVTLTDFSTPPIPEGMNLPPHLVISSEQHNLFDPLGTRPKEDRYDAIVSTYGFDSVWLPQDVHMEKRGGKYYQLKHRVKVADWHPRKAELIQALQNGQALPAASADDYAGIYVEEAAEEVDVANQPYGSYIQNRLDTMSYRSVNFPGGLIKTVAEAFEGQLGKDGVFIIGDVGDFDQGNVRQRSSLISGVAARYKTEDFILAKEVLEGEFGLEVSIMPLDKLADNYLQPGWEADAKEIELEQINKNPSNGIMVIRRREQQVAE